MTLVKLNKDYLFNGCKACPCVRYEIDEENQFMYVFCWFNSKLSYKYDLYEHEDLNKADGVIFDWCPIISVESFKDES